MATDERWLLQQIREVDKELYALDRCELESLRDAMARLKADDAPPIPLDRSGQLAWARAATPALTTEAAGAVYANHKRRLEAQKERLLRSLDEARGKRVINDRAWWGQSNGVAAWLASHAAPAQPTCAGTLKAELERRREEQELAVALDASARQNARPASAAAAAAASACAGAAAGADERKD